MEKFVKDSNVIMHELILPNDTNNLNTVFGGKVMQYMDCLLYTSPSPRD